MCCFVFETIIGAQEFAEKYIGRSEIPCTRFSPVITIVQNHNYSPCTKQGKAGGWFYKVGIWLGLCC